MSTVPTTPPRATKSSVVREALRRRRDAPIVGTQIRFAVRTIRDVARLIAEHRRNGAKP